MHGVGLAPTDGLRQNFLLIRRKVANRMFRGTAKMAGGAITPVMVDRQNTSGRTGREHRRGTPNTALRRHLSHPRRPLRQGGCRAGGRVRSYQSSTRA